MKRDTPAESAWRHYCKTPLADFFRGLRLIVAGDFRNANTNLYCADMTEIPFSLELLDEDEARAQLAKLDEPCVWCEGEADRQGYVCVCNDPLGRDHSQLEPHAFSEPEPMDDLASFLGGEAPIDDLVSVPPVDPKPYSSYLDHL